MPIVAIDEQLAQFRLDAYGLCIGRARSLLQEYHRRIREACAVSTSTGAVTLQGQEASAAVNRGYEVGVATTLDLADLYPYHRWIRILRALPGELFDGTSQGHQGSYVARRITAEALASLGSAPTILDQPNSLTEIVWFSDQDWSRVLEFVFSAWATAHIDGIRIYAARNVPIVFATNGTVIPDTSHDLWRDSQTYTERLNSGDHFGLLTGLSHPAAPITVDSFSPDVLVGMGYRGFEPLEKSCIEEQSLWGLTLRDWGFWVGQSPTLVPRILREFAWYPADLPALMFLLQVTSFLIYSLGTARQVQLLRHGVVLLPRSDVMQILATFLQRESIVSAYEQAFSAENVRAWTAESLMNVAQAPASLQPLLPGPVIGAANRELVFVDPVAGTRRVGKLMSPSSTGDAMSEARGREFEKSIQSVIDETPWAPPLKLRKSVGKELKRRDGSIITDLDAIAFKDGVVVIVDAKSYVRPQTLEGDYASIRNIRMDLEVDLAKWRSKVAEIRASGSLDLSDCREVIPLVVTAGVHFVHKDLLEPMVLSGRLHPVVSLEEFRTVLAAGT